MTAPRFIATETGLRLLSDALRWNRTAASALRHPARIAGTALGPVAREQTQRQGLYLRVVSISEATIDALALELTQSGLKYVDEVVRRLVLEKEIAGTASWDSRRRSFKRHHNVDLRKCDAHKELLAATEARNAIAHGLGKLTARQAASNETLKDLSSISIDVVDGYIRLRPTHVAEAIGFSRRFIIDVDGRARSH